MWSIYVFLRIKFSLKKRSTFNNSAICWTRVEQQYVFNAMFLRKFYMLRTNVVRSYQKQHKRLNEKMLKYLQQNPVCLLSPEKSVGSSTCTSGHSLNVWTCLWEQSTFRFLTVNWLNTCQFFLHGNHESCVCLLPRKLQQSEPAGFSDEKGNQESQVCLHHT